MIRHLLLDADNSYLIVQFFKDKGIKVVTIYPPATFSPMTTDRDDMEPVPEKEAQPSDIAKAAMLVSPDTPGMPEHSKSTSLKRLDRDHIKMVSCLRLSHVLLMGQPC